MFAFPLQQQRDGDEFRVVKMVDVAIQFQGPSVDLAHGFSEALQSAAGPRDRRNAHSFYSFIAIMTSDKNHFVSRLNQRSADFVKDARIKNPVRGR
jgi:hypothetical protein